MASPRDLLRDLGHAERGVLRSPGHAFVVVTTLALAVGAGAAVKHLGFESEADPAVYVPFRQQPIPLAAVLRQE